MQMENIPYTISVIYDLRSIPFASCCLSLSLTASRSVSLTVRPLFKRTFKLNQPLLEKYSKDSIPIGNLLYDIHTNTNTHTHKLACGETNSM